MNLFLSFIEAFAELAAALVAVIGGNSEQVARLTAVQC